MIFETNDNIIRELPKLPVFPGSNNTQLPKSISQIKAPFLPRIGRKPVEGSKIHQKLNGNSNDPWITDAESRFNKITSVSPLGQINLVPTSNKRIERIFSIEENITENENDPILTATVYFNTKKYSI
jgi:hypothetical protein